MQHKTFRGVASEIKFSENITQDTILPIQLFKCGKFYDDRYGCIEITPELLKTMSDNFSAKIRKIDLALDFMHANWDKAAGWFTSCEIRDDGTMWANVKLTKAGAESIASKEFRYISPEFDLEYTDNETLSNHGPTLLGAGLTNRPVIKGMSPTFELKELTNKEIEEMDLKTLATSVETLTKAIEGQTKKLSDMEKKVEEVEASVKEAAAPGDEGKEGEMSIEQALAKISELQAKVAELEAKDKEVAASVAAAEKNKAFDKMLSEGKAVEAQRAPFVAGDMVKFAELAGKIKLGTQGSSKDGGAADDDSEEKTLELAQEKMKTDKSLSLKSAISLVLSEKKSKK